ncbi:uncharacterized protein [Antedon mediterranea]|uniref:uncharacterized protein isoform X2 n=1 Tax=Antedon mediterranea TaxID=105859 RepID=UPI003AF9A610
MEDISSQHSLTSSQETEDGQDAEEYDFENFNNEEDEMDYLARHFPYIAAQVMQNDPEASEDALLFTSPEHKEAMNTETYLLGLPSIDLTECMDGTKTILEETINGNQSHDTIKGDDVDEKEALFDSLLATNSTEIDNDVLNFDINSEELQKFIEEFEAISKYDEHLSKQKRKRNIKNGKTDKYRNGDNSTDWHSPGGNSKVKFSKTKQLKVLVANLLKSSKVYRTTRQTEQKTETGTDKCKDSSSVTVDKSIQDEKQKLPTHRTNGTEKKSVGKLLGTEIKNSPRSKTKHKENVPPQDRHVKQSTTEDRIPSKAPSKDNYEKQLSNERLLVKATMNGDLNKMKYFLDSNESLCSISDLKGNTLLHVAAKFSHLECLQYLLARVSPDLLQRENNDCLTPTALAVKHGQKMCMEWLISETSSVAELEVQDNRWSLLHIAARYGQESCLRWLLSYMLNEDLPLDVLDNKGNTPAHLSAKYGHLPCVQTLVEYNQDITLLNKKQQTPCTLALKHGFSSCAQFLVVVEACSTLSDQVVRLQRELREIEQENTVLKSRLDDAVTCTDGLIQMQKTDLMKKVDEVRAEYKSLTSMLIKKLDMMHLQSKDKDSNSSAQAKEKADLLNDVCDCLVNECSNRRSPEGSELQKIENTIQRIQEPYQRPTVSSDEPHQPMNLLRSKLKDVSLQILKVTSAKTDEDKRAWGMKPSSENSLLTNTQSSTLCSTQSSPPSSSISRSIYEDCDRKQNINSGCYVKFKLQTQLPTAQNGDEFASHDKFYSGSSKKIEAKTATIVKKPVHSPQSSGSSSSSLGLGPKVSKSEMRGERLRTYFAKKSEDGHCKVVNGDMVPLDSDHDSITHELASQSSYNRTKTTPNGSISGSRQSQIISSHASLNDSPAVSTSLKDVYKKSRPSPIVEKIENSTENLHRIFSRHLPANKYAALKQMPDYLRQVQTTKPQQRKMIKIDIDGETMLSTVVEEHHELLDTITDSKISCDVPVTNGNTEKHMRSGILTPPGEQRKKGKNKHITFAIDEKSLYKERESMNDHNLFYKQQEKEFEQRNTEMKSKFDRCIEKPSSSVMRTKPVQKANIPPRKIRPNGQLLQDNLRIANGMTDEVGDFGDMDSTWNETASDDTHSRAWYDSSDEEVEKKHKEKHESYL